MASIISDFMDLSKTTGVKLAVTELLTLNKVEI